MTGSRLRIRTHSPLTLSPSVPSASELTVTLSGEASLGPAPQNVGLHRFAALRGGLVREPAVLGVPHVLGRVRQRQGVALRDEDAGDVAPAAAEPDRDGAAPAPLGRARRVERGQPDLVAAPPQQLLEPGRRLRRVALPTLHRLDAGQPHADPRARLVAGDIHEDRVAVVDRHHAPAPHLARRLVAGDQARAGAGRGVACQPRREGEREHGAEQSAHLQWNTAHRREVRYYGRNSAPGNVNCGIEGEGSAGTHFPTQRS